MSLRARRAPELSLVIPTYNERANVPRILVDLVRVLDDLPYEVIVVDDDSPDGTWKYVDAVSSGNPRIRSIRRIGPRRDLAQSVLEGLHAARGRVLGSMNADGSHDPEAIMALWKRIREGSDIAVASRYVRGASLAGWTPHRKLLSALATRLARAATGVSVRDPLSGFYLLRRETYERVLGQIDPRGFKILIEILVRGGPANIAEVPICFRNRRSGRSKLSLKVIWYALVQLVALAALRRRPSVGFDGRPAQKPT